MTASFDKHYRLFMESDGDSPVPIDNQVGQVGRERWPSSGSAAEMFKQQKQQASANTKFNPEDVEALGREIDDMPPDQQKLVLSNLKKFLGATKNTLIFLLKVGNLITTSVRPGAKVVALTAIGNMVYNVNGVIKKFKIMEDHGRSIKSGNFDLGQITLGDGVAALTRTDENTIFAILARLNDQNYILPVELHDTIRQAVTMTDNYNWWAAYLFYSALFIWISNRSRTLGGNKGFGLNPIAGTNKLRFARNQVKVKPKNMLTRMGNSVGRILGGGREGGSG